MDTLDNMFHKRFEERENKLFKAGKTLAFKAFCKHKVILKNKKNRLHKKKKGAAVLKNNQLFYSPHFKSLKPEV